MIDMLVVGGGPAGVATALHASRAGLRVTLIEPRTAPIDKACGEGLMPGAVASLRRLGVTAPGQPFHGIRYVAGSRMATATFRDGSGVGVRRTELHDRLWRALAESNVDVVCGRVDSIAQTADAVSAHGMRARYLVGADGLHSLVRRLVGCDGAPARLRRWGQRAHFDVPAWTDHVEVHWSADAEAYVTPTSPHCVGVAILSARRDSFEALLAGFPELAERLSGRRVDVVRAAGPLHQRVPSRVAGRVLLVGDAAGYVDALTGEGLALGFACAEALVRRVVAGDPSGYEADYRRITRRYRLITGALVHATRARPVRTAIVPTAARVPSLFAKVVEQLAGT